MLTYERFAEFRDRRTRGYTPRFRGIPSKHLQADWTGPTAKLLAVASCGRPDYPPWPLSLRRPYEPALSFLDPRSGPSRNPEAASTEEV